MLGEKDRAPVEKSILLISSKILGPDANRDVPVLIFRASGALQSVTFVSLQPRQEQSLQTILLKLNPDLGNRRQSSEE